MKAKSPNLNKLEQVVPSLPETVTGCVLHSWKSRRNLSIRWGLALLLHQSFSLDRHILDDILDIPLGQAHIGHGYFILIEQAHRQGILFRQHLVGLF